MPMERVDRPAEATGRGKNGLAGVETCTSRH